MKTITVSIDSDLLQRFKDGDRQAIGSLLEQLRPYVRVILRSVCGNRSSPVADESDLLQDVFLQAVRSAGKFQGNSLGEFVRWVRVLAIRSSQRTLARKKGVELAVTDLRVANELADIEALGPENIVLLQENSAQIAAALNRLPEEMREVLLFRLVDGMSHAQIAERMNRTPGAVRMLFLRSLDRLRDEVEENDVCMWK